MDKKTKIGLGALVAVVVVVAAVVASNTTNLQGAFRGKVTGETNFCYNARQACETGNARRRDAQCANYLVQCGSSLRARCQQLVRWSREGTLSANVRSNSGSVPGEMETCSTYAPDIYVEHLISSNFCNELATWRIQGVLSANLQSYGRVYQYAPQACARLFPKAWNNPVTENRCRQYATWYRQGVLTSMGGAAAAAEFQNVCQNVWPTTWYEAFVTKPLCQQLADWNRAGTLSANLRSNGIGVLNFYACQNVYPAFF